MSRGAVGKAPVVTGLSPKEGVPGTPITIRGENLGSGHNDIIGVFICGTDCTMSARWESSRKIHARCGQAKGGLGEVVVITRSGGKGYSTVMFRVYIVQIGPLQESAVWIDESRVGLGLDGQSSHAATIVDDDPLGISDERDEKINSSGLMESFPDGSGNQHLANFVPAWFLLERHKNATFDDLKTGLAYMQKQSHVSQEGTKDLLKSNLYSFLSCVDSLASLKDKIDQERDDNGWPLTNKLQNQVEDVSKQAEGLFSQVLNRKEKADSSRNALSILQRYKFLFFLPQLIEKNLERGDYGSILHDYTKAKSLFGDTEVPLFQEAYAQVEDRISKCKKTLMSRLLEMPSTLDEQRKIICHLLSLDAEADPGWDCLKAHNEWLDNLLWDAQTKCSSQAKRDASLDDSDYEDKLVTDLPQQFVFCELILGTLMTKLQHLNKLGKAYIEGKLSSKHNLHKEELIEGMILNTVNLASWLILNAVLPDCLPSQVSTQIASKLVKWPRRDKMDNTIHLMQTLRNLRNCISSLLQQEFSAKQVKPLIELCVTVRKTCLDRVVNQAINGVLELQRKETWKMQVQEQDFAKTNLPDLFDTQIQELLPMLRQLLSHSSFPGEIDLFVPEHTSNALQALFKKLVCSFRDVLERLARVGSSTGRPGELNLQTNDNNTNTATPAVKDRKLLIALSNCDYTLRFSLEPIVAKLGAHGVRKTEHLLQTCRESYAQLRSVLIKKYIAVKCLPFDDLIMLMDYTLVTHVTSVSNYICDLVLLIVSMQAELFLSSRHFLRQVMSYVVRSCAEHIAGHVSGYKPDPQEKNDPGTMQALLDLDAFELSVKPLLSQDTIKILAAARVPFDTNIAKKSMEPILATYERRMRLALMSINNDDNLEEEAAEI